MNNNDELQMQVSPICNKNGEKLALEDYMKQNLEMLKDLAKENNPIKSFMK